MATKVSGLFSLVLEATIGRETFLAGLGGKVELVEEVAASKSGIKHLLVAT